MAQRTGASRFRHGSRARLLGNYGSARARPPATFELLPKPSFTIAEANVASVGAEFLVRLS